MKAKGFTLLEVMIAVAILGLSLTAIFSSEVGAVNVALRAKRQNVATSLARCKMGEIEELIAAEGLPAVEKSGQDGCCEHAPVDGYACDWVIDRIILPDISGGDEEEFDPSAELDLDMVADQVGDPQEILASGMGNMASLALQLGYPIMKPSLEEQVRRATVRVYWLEGEQARGFDVVQFLVADQPSALLEEAIAGAASDDPSAAGATGSGTGTGADGTGAATGTGRGADGRSVQEMSGEERLRELQRLLQEGR